MAGSQTGGEDVLESCCIVDCQACFAACTLQGKDRQAMDQIFDLASAMMMQSQAISLVKSHLLKTVLQTVVPYLGLMADEPSLG